MDEQQEDEEDEEDDDEAPDKHVLNLLVPMFSSLHDEYGKDTVPPLPLLFDQVSEGQKPCSEAPLLRLPVGILAEIVRYLEWSSLPSFTLVNKDC